MRLDAIIFWVRSVGPSGKDRIPMYFKGLCDRRDEGQVGYDVKGRPVSLGTGEYTGTYGGGDFEYEDGRPIRRS
jgi:hypothetical protein